MLVSVTLVSLAFEPPAEAAVTMELPVGTSPSMEVMRRDHRAHVRSAPKADNPKLEMRSARARRLLVALLALSGNVLVHCICPLGGKADMTFCGAYVGF